ncbi:IS200/IS605 family transposase [Prosthecobacter dejongeii]|uniref:REP element-mobilizing transposase RayT n=1 Tax=Prosthecobacter dejongeii TaxID=48465 RepID=A0A7W7YK81_9BACT|nr:IS200/IS605 family transposase [Prosthecobacter dejongeii]MBB5037425.1 REP element-mobilizing transposase RayT [Prosthecobacter dejongeii]
MPSTYSSLHYHLIFSTKNREPLIQTAWRARLHEYLGGMVRGLGGVSLGVGGVSDHVHLLVGLKPTHCLADVMRDLKKDATHWVQTTVGERGFFWQEGYAAITVSPPGLPGVRNYIAHQEEHHRQRGFREELKEILTQAGIPFDERYLD